MAKVAKTKNSGTYKNLVGATNYYNAVLQNLQNLQIPVNKINNMQYVLNAVNIATYNTNPVALQYNPIVNQFVPIYQTILDTINNPNEISNIYQLLDNITEELNASGNECELEFMANNQFILTTYTSNGNCIINVMPGGANISCSVGICGTANLLYTDTYNF